MSCLSCIMLFALFLAHSYAHEEQFCGTKYFEQTSAVLKLASYKNASDPCCDADGDGSDILHGDGQPLYVEIGWFVHSLLYQSIVESKSNNYTEAQAEQAIRDWAQGFVDRANKEKMTQFKDGIKLVLKRIHIAKTLSEDVSTHAVVGGNPHQYHADLKPATIKFKREWGVDVMFYYTSNRQHLFGKNWLGYALGSVCIKYRSQPFIVIRSPDTLGREHNYRTFLHELGHALYMPDTSGKCKGGIMGIGYDFYTNCVMRIHYKNIDALDESRTNCLLNNPDNDKLKCRDDDQVRCRSDFRRFAAKLDTLEVTRFLCDAFDKENWHAKHCKRSCGFCEEE